MTTLRNRLSGDLILLLLMLIAGIGAIAGGIGYQVTLDNGQVGPGFMPVAAGVLIAVPTVIQLVRQLRPAATVDEADGDSATLKEELAAEAASITEASHSDDLDEFGRSDTERGRAVFVIFLLIGAAVLLTELIGLLLAVSLLVTAIYTLVEKHAWWKGLIAGGTTLFFGWLVFKTLLQVSLPTGQLGLI